MTKKVLVSLPEKVVEVIDILIEQGDYRNRSSFISEACRAHLNTWYESLWSKPKTKKQDAELPT